MIYRILLVINTENAVKADPTSDATADAGTNACTGVAEDVTQLGGWGIICI